MGLEPILFIKGRDPTPSLIELKRAILKQAEDHFDLGFGPHQAVRAKILWEFRRLASLPNIRSALFPKRHLTKEDVVPLTPRIKNDEMEREQLEHLGVIPSYAKDIHLYASIYILPAPFPLAREASSHAEEYAQIRPYVRESLLCRLPNQDPAFYIVAGAYGFTGSMVVDARNRGPVSHYHLAPSCLNGKAEPLRTEDVRCMDGMKIYIPVQIKERDKVYDRTFVLSTTLSVWEGIKGWVKRRKSEESHATVYGLGGVGEILSVLKRMGSTPEN